MTDSGSTTNISGGVNIGDSATIGGDVVGRDKITHNEQINTGGDIWYELILGGAYVYQTP